MKMKIGFDLDGTLDRPALRDLCLALLKDGHEIHIITGTFTEAKGWQDADAKHRKLRRLGIPYRDGGRYVPDALLDPAAEEIVGEMHDYAVLHIIDAVPVSFDRNYRLADIGLRKGALCEELGIKLFFDDSTNYCEMIPKMSGDTLVLKVGEGK